MQCQSQLLTLGEIKLCMIRCKSTTSREENVCERKRKTEKSEGGDMSREEGGRKKEQDQISDPEQ